MIPRSLFEAALSALLLLVVPVSQAATASQPNPPVQVCVNNSCVTTSTAGGKIKWHPGHYMASYTVLGPGETISTIQGELNDLTTSVKTLGLPIKGYRVLLEWSAVTDTVKGSYNWALLDSIVAYCANLGVQVVVTLLPGSFNTGHLTSAPGSWIGVPTYILNNPQYGPSPVSGSYGWWGTAPNQTSNVGPGIAAMWRTPGEYGGTASVATEYANTLAAIGARYNGNANYEATMVPEDAWMSSVTEFAPGSDYNSTTMIANLKTVLTAAVNSHPNTSVIMENTWLNTSDAAEEFEQWMMANRVAAGAADTVGQTAFTPGQNGQPTGYLNPTTALGLAWGLEAYLGVTTQNGGTWAYPGPGTSYREQGYRAMLDIEAQELIGHYYNGWTTPEGGLNGTITGTNMDGFTPLDFIQAANQTYGASHLFWTHFFGTEQFGSPSFACPTGTKWSNLQYTLAANPLTTTGYPSNYP